MTYLAPDGDLAALASYCGIKTPTAAIMADLAEDVAAAAAAVEDRCGPVQVTTATVALRGAQAAIVTPWRPVSLTSYVTEAGESLDVSGWIIDGFRVWRTAWQIIPAGTLTYTTGYAAEAIPPALVIVGKQVLRQLWRARIGNPRAEGEPGVGVLWPRQAEVLAEPYALPPLGFA